MNRIIVILDRSGSMSLAKSGTISGFNTFLQNQKAHLFTNGRSCKFTLLLFNHTISLFNYENIFEVPEMNDTVYKTDGLTSLYDAMGQIFENLGSERNNLCLIISDGEDNTSKAWKASRVQEFVQHLQNLQSWVFFFYGANNKSCLEASRIGITHIQNYLQTIEGSHLLFNKISDDVDLICSQFSSATL